VDELKSARTNVFAPKQLLNLILRGLINPHARDTGIESSPLAQ